VQVPLQPRYGAPRMVWAAEIDGDFIIEGDICLGPPAPSPYDRGPRPRAIGLQHRRRLWPGGMVPFVIGGDIRWPARVEQALGAWQSVTPVRFTPRSSQASWLVFRRGPACQSHVGMVGGAQYVYLDESASIGTIAHEVGHAIGLWHEQSRSDRDRYVRVEYGNIDPALHYQFNQRVNDGRDLGSYDYDSLMHYPANAFALDSHKTTISVPPGIRIGQRTRISTGDAAAVTLLYRGG
jgi:hypothetical protein